MKTNSQKDLWYTVISLFKVDMPYIIQRKQLPTAYI